MNLLALDVGNNSIARFTIRVPLSGGSPAVLDCVALAAWITIDGCIEIVDVSSRANGPQM
jgi:hypothetical protein